mmetsp:Transcript_13950/g.44818  ORF Transcript_13950/g.44818 Transcript_13950/m.44818 type:complete len:513 (-) Transcript_13950:317-1855(-)
MVAAAAADSSSYERRRTTSRRATSSTKESWSLVYSLVSRGRLRLTSSPSMSSTVVAQVVRPDERPRATPLPQPAPPPPPAALRAHTRISTYTVAPARPATDTKLHKRVSQESGSPLPSLVPDVAEDAEAAREEDGEDGHEHADARPLVAQHRAAQAVKVEHGDGRAVCVEEELGLAVRVALELVVHHRRPAVPDEGRPAVPRPLRRDLVREHDEPRHEHDRGDVSRQHRGGRLERRRERGDGIGECDRDHCHQVVGEHQDEEAALELHAPEDDDGEEERREDAQEALLDDLVREVGKGAVAAVVCLAVEKRPVEDERGHHRGGAVAAERRHHEECASDARDLSGCHLAPLAQVEREHDEREDELVADARPQVDRVAVVGERAVLEQDEDRPQRRRTLQVRRHRHRRLGAVAVRQRQLRLETGPSVALPKGCGEGGGGEGVAVRRAACPLGGERARLVREELVVDDCVRAHRVHQPPCVPAGGRRVLDALGERALQGRVREHPHVLVLQWAGP